jgi:glycerol-3-phosphate cytidylyltransferase-like family protein
MKIGVIAGNFDVIHPGYIHMFKECEKNSFPAAG